VKYTQFLCFEVGRECNLAGYHQDCPSGTLDRYGSLDVSTAITDKQVVDSAVEAYAALGFAGNVAWHYYNEPMLQWDRLQALMAAIREKVTSARFTLWTNGTLLHKGTAGLDLLDQIWVTNYRGRDWNWLHERVPRVVVFAPYLDERRRPLEKDKLDFCLRPYNELIVDNYGNGHLCCADWRGACVLGNIRDADGFAGVVERFQAARNQASQQPMPDDAPNVCRRCRIRQRHIADLVPAVQKITEEDKPWITKQPIL